MASTVSEYHDNPVVKTEQEDEEEEEEEEEEGRREAPSTLALTSRTTSCCGRVLQTLRAEFFCKNFGFNFPAHDVFYSSQWPLPHVSFVIYRLLLAAYSLTVLIVSIVGFNNNKRIRPWPVWLTSWSYLILTSHLVCAAIIVLVHSHGRRCCTRSTLARTDSTSLLSSEHGERAGYPRMAWYLQLDWLLFATSSCAALLVTLVYFIGLYPLKHAATISADDANLHLMNSVMVALEFIVTAIPVRLLHFIYPLVYCSAYAGFSAVYWAVDHNNTLYPGVLDWNHPDKTAVVLVILGCAVIPVIVCIYYLAFQLRLFVYRRIRP